MKTKTLKEEDLLLCPNCNSSPHVWTEEEFDWKTYKIHCRNCWVETPTYDSKQYAMKTWNKRKDDYEKENKTKP